LRLPYVVSIDFWQYKVEVEIMAKIDDFQYCIDMKSMRSFFLIERLFETALSLVIIPQKWCTLLES